MLLDFQNTEVAFHSKSTSELRRSVFIFSLLKLPWMVTLGALVMKAALFLRLPVAFIIRRTVFWQFCGGETLEESYAKANNLAQFGVGTILDVAVEGSQLEKEFNRTADEVLQTIELAKDKPSLPFCVFKPSGVARAELLEKVQSQIPLSPTEKAEWDRIRERILRMCQRAYDLKVRFLIDAEESWIQEPIDSLAAEMMARFNQEAPIIYNTVQMYRHDRLAFIGRCIEEARAKNYKLALKIVRGAYLEKERERARAAGVLSPVFERKEVTDEAYNQAVRLCLHQPDPVAILVGTHNENSTQIAIDEMERLGLKNGDRRVAYSQLYGMSDHLTFQLAKHGYHVTKYLPFGGVRVLLPYLIRRAQENTAVHGQTSRELELLEREITRRRSLTN